MLKGALIANAASLGFNWVYNMPYLETLAQGQSLVFQKPNIEHYTRAKKAFFGYPHAEVGDVSFQGEIAQWLYVALKSNSDFSRDDYLNLVFEKVQPAGDYVGYAESYARKLVLNRYMAQFEINQNLPQDDDQLIGFIPFLVCKELQLSNEKAFELAKAFTDNVAYKQFYQMFDYVFMNIKKQGAKEAFTQCLNLAPEGYRTAIQQAINEKDTKTFIMNYSGTACHIPHAIPLIIHIIVHTRSFEEAVQLNTRIGGASSDRGMLIGALMEVISPVPSSWASKISFK